MHVYENSAEEVVNQSAAAGEHEIISGFETPPSKTHIFCSEQIRHSQIFASNALQKMTVITTVNNIMPVFFITEIMLFAFSSKLHRAAP